MVLDLLQAGIRTAYRTLGAREVVHGTGRSELHGFSFEGGHERSVVLLHGLGDASTTWFHTVRPLGARFDLLALDLPPFGLSRLEAGPYLTPRQLAREVATLIDHAFEVPVHLVGQSLGGWVAAWVALEAPDLVDRLALVSPAGAPLPGARERLDLLTPQTADDVLELWEAMWYRPPAVAKVIPRAVLHRFQRPGFREFVESLKEIDVPTSTEAGEPVDPTILEPDEQETLEALDMLVPDRLAGGEHPALVVWGRHDGILDPGTPGYLARHWGAPMERSYLARTAHLPHLERSGTVVARLDAFLDP